MDLRLPIAIAVGLTCSAWLAWSELNKPGSAKRLEELSIFTLIVGVFFLSLTIFFNINRYSISDILMANISHVNSQGSIAFSYTCFLASVIFREASRRAKS